MVRSEIAGRKATSGGIFREHDGLFRAPERSGGTERCEVSGANDVAELQAEQTADQVMGGGIFREAGAPGAEGGTAEVSSADLSEPGSALPDGLRQSMGESMGADFSNVRVHTGPGADRASESVAARAFTKGEDVYFRSGEYDPVSQEGQHLIAHELAHVAHGDGGIHRADPPETSGSPAAAPAPAPAPEEARITALPDDPATLTEEQAPKLKEFLDSQYDALPKEEDLKDLKAKYLDKTGVVVDQEIGNDNNTANELRRRVNSGTEIQGKLASGKDKDAVPDKIKQIYSQEEERFRERLDQVSETVNKLPVAIFQEGSDAAMGHLSPIAEEMVLDPAFEQFKKAVGDLKKVGDSFEAEDDAAMNRAKKNITLGKEGAEVSLKQKQESLGINAADEEESGLSRWAGGLHAASESTSEVAGDIGAVAGTGTNYVKGKKLDKMEEGEAKEKAEKEAEELASNREEGAASITEGVGSALSGIGGAMDAAEIGKQAGAQRDQDAKAKQAMKNVGVQLERTVAKGDLTPPSETARAPRIQAVCDRVKKEKFNHKENQSMTALIDNAMADKNAAGADITPELGQNQKQLLTTLRLLESSRASSKAKASELRKETFFSALDSVGSFFSSAGSLATGIGKLVDSSLGGIVGAVLSLVGKIIGQVGAFRSKMAGEENAGEETDKKMQAGRSVIKQMAALPSLDSHVWENVSNAAHKKPGATTITREQAGAVDQYASVFVSIQAANLNISDILFAIERGEFGKGAGTEQAKSAQDSLDDMYANLSMS